MNVGITILIKNKNFPDYQEVIIIKGSIVNSNILTPHHSLA